MIEITEENIDSMIASINSHDEEEYIERLWGNIEVENPALLEFIIDLLMNYDDDEESEKSAFLDGVCHVYELFRRQIEAQELESM